MTPKFSVSPGVSRYSMPHGTRTGALTGVAVTVAPGSKGTCSASVGATLA
jgi:hypothetical protein